MIDDLTKDDFDKYVTPAKPRRTREFRTDRNNNPIAAAVTTGGRNQFTNALDQAEIPWEHGDPFPNNPGLSTIRIKGDPYEGARAILSNSNALKWYRNTTGKTVLPKYGVRSNADFAKLPIDHQNDIINGIYQSEGGSGRIKPAQDDFDKYVSTSAPQQQPAQPVDADFDKYVTPSPTQQQPKEKVTSVSLEEPPEIEGGVLRTTSKAYKTQAEAQAAGAVKPIEFKPGTGEPSNLLVRAAQHAEGARLPQGKLPETHPDLTAAPVRATFDKLPETNEAIDAVMAQISPQALKANQSYRAETGRNLGVTSGDISSLTKQTPDGKYELSVAPTQRLIRTVNAYNRGGASEAEAENAKMSKEADDYLHEQAKTINQQSVSALKEGATSAVTGNAQFLYNLSMLGRALYTKSRYGDESPQYKALENEDADNQKLLTAAQQGTQAKSTLGEIIGAVGELPQIMATGGNMPMATYVRHLNEGQVNAGLAAIKTIPVQAMFHAVGGATENLPRLQQEAIARAGAGTLNAVMAPEGQRARAFATGALLPIPMSHGAKAEAGEGASEPAAEVLPEAEQPRHVDLQRRLDDGTFGKETKIETESRRAQVNPTPSAEPTERINPPLQTSQEVPQAVNPAIPVEQAGATTGQTATTPPPALGVSEPQWNLESEATGIPRGQLPSTASETVNRRGVTDGEVSDAAFRQLRDNGLRDLPRTPIFVGLDMSQSRGIGSTEIELTPELRLTGGAKSFVVFPNADGKTGWAYSNPRGGSLESARQAGFSDREQGRPAVLGEGGKWIVGKETVQPEQAKSDAKTLTSDLLSTFRPSESGELNTTANTPFIRNFMRDIVSPNDLGRYVSAEGELSQEGLARIRNAIFAKAYGDSPEGLRALEKIAESPDSNVRNITNALLQRAGQFASLKDAIAKGDRYPLDLTSDLTKALGKLSSLREEETSVADYLNQRQLFEEDLTPLQKQALKMFDEYKRSTKAISSVLDNYAKAVEAIGDPKQQTMFGGEVPSKDSILDAAIRETIDDAKRQSDLFSSERVQPEPATRPGDQAVIETAQAPSASEAATPKEPEFVRAARERAAQRLAEKQQGIEYRHAGADPYELLDSLIVRGWELYDQKVRPTFEEWARKLREEFGPKAEEHLRTVWAQVSGGEQTGKRQSEIPGMEQTPPETTGIAHRVETAARGAEPLRGQAIGAQESIERGRQLLREGGNLKAALDGFEKSGAISADAVALVRARHEELAQAANRAFDVGRQKLDSPEFRAAEKVRQDFYDNAVKPMQTAWSNTGRAQQGETDIDTETFYGMYRAFKDFKGREPSPREAVEIQLLAERNARVDSDVKNLSSQLAAELDRAAGIKDLPGEVQKSLSRFIDQAKRESRRTGRQQTRKSLDDEAVVIKQSLAAAFQKVREQKGVQPSGLARLDPEGEVTKQVIALAKNRVKAGVTDAAQLIDDVHGAIKEFADVTKREVTEAILGQGTPKGTRVESEWAKTKKGVAASLKAEDIETTQRELGERLQRGPISPEDASAVWKYARENYADKGNNNFAEIRAKVASDLGISPETVTRSLANTKAAKQISNEMWAKMSDRRRLRSNAESWIKQADAPLAVKLFDDARRLWFIKATVGHGAVAPFTHAPANAFIPARWADFWRNFGRTYQFMVNKGGHERAMSDLETSPNYITAQRAGLANDPKRGYDEYQSPWMGKVLGKLGVSGNRAFDSLKTMRQDMFDSAWNKMTNDLKTPETAKALVQEINASTGSSKALSGQDWPSRFVGKAMFAAPLEASRWDFLVRDNYRAIKAFTNWKNATLGERYMAKRVASRNAQLVATYGALLAANQGLLNASGSDDKINVTDPTKSDFLAFKVGGHVVSPAGGLLTAVRFVGNLVNIGTENKKPREKISDASTVTFKYGRSKLSPLFGTGADIWLQSDYSGRPLPFSKEEGTSKFPRYTWPEYIWSTQTPIPLAEAARTYYAEREKGTSRTDALAKSVPIGAVAATGIRVREDFPSGPASDIYGSDRPKARKEIERLGMQVRGVSKQPDESLKEFEARQAGVNPYIRRALEQVVSDPEYQKDSDLNKIERLKQAKEAAQKEGQAAWDDEHEKPEKDEKPEYPRPSGAPQASLKHWLPPRNPFKRGSESFRV